MPRSLHRYLTLAVLSVCLLTLSACAQLQNTRSSALPASVQLSPHADDPKLLSWRSSRAALPRRYLLAPVVWEIEDEQVLRAGDRQQLEAALSDSIHAALAGFERVERPGEAVVRVQPVITGVNPSSPAANAALLLVVGPADTGGASLTVHIEDVESGAPLAVLALAHNGRMFSTRGFRRWGHAEQAFEKAAAHLPELFNSAEISHAR